MDWTMEEAISYYKTQGAPRDQNALINLLREIQKEEGGSIPVWAPERIAAAYDVKPGMILLLIKRIPSLRLGDRHCLELCAGPNCSKRKEIAACAEALAAENRSKVALKYGPCMRMCGKGPNLRWDGRVYHQTTEQLLRELMKEL